ncbi:hypothetical protein H4582DRAFT_610591 [Lactarius indigo]|nr:hypothetical protein H4582DRAFT_610591 [Lactarius indigo]
MTHTTDIPANKEVHFLHSDDPRDGFHVMGTDPLVFYSFLTPIGFLTTHTIVNDASGATVATLNWTGSSALGTVTWPGSTPTPSETHMCDLVMAFPSMPDSRAFSCEGPDRVVRTFWWRRLPYGNYDLYVANEPDVCVGLFRMHRPPEQLTVGDNYATLFFVFLHEPLLLHALLALCLNRWLDREVVGLE